MTTFVWTAVLAAGLLWPARTLSWFDGVPLDGRIEAIVVGVFVPALWWFDRSVLQRTWMRSCAVLLLLVKVSGSFLTPEGLCARFEVSAPFGGQVQTIPIDEPSGVLRSWDVRANWRDERPSCTAIFDRPYRRTLEFPAWFVNVLDFIRPGPRHVSLSVSGAVSVSTSGTFTLRTGEGMRVDGRIGDRSVEARSGQDIAVALTPGTYPIGLRASLAGDRWRFEPLWNGDSAWRTAFLTVSAPRRWERELATIAAAVTTTSVLAIVAGWAVTALLRVEPAILPWTGVASAALAAAAVNRVGRFSGLLFLATAFVPLTARSRNLRSAFLLLGVPWLVFFVVRALPDVGRVTEYSQGDWLTYQVAGYRIFLGGHWLEGGSRTFDYQPLYRWTSGILHMVFGDSSVGEIYLDAASLLGGALLAYVLARAAAGVRAGLFAGAATLATFMLGPTWYLVGRGLSETVAAGFAFLAAFFLLRARLGHVKSSVTAGVLSTLMFYTRLNHLLLAGFLLALLLPHTTTTSARDVYRALRAVRFRSAAGYVCVFAAGVALLATRTWWFTGVFGIFYGTSLKNNDLGLRPSTLGSPDVWRKVAHSLVSLVTMNEPARFDVRAVLVCAGVLCATLAAVQMPWFRRLPAALVIVTLGAMAGSLFVHTHNYPGRMTVVLVPFATALGVSAATCRWRAVRIRQPAVQAVT